MKDNLKWTKSKIFLIAFNCVLCVAIVISAMMIVIDKSRIKNGAVYTPADGESTTADAQANKSVTLARLMISGDNIVYQTVFSQASEKAGGKGYDFSNAYDGLKEIIAKSDLALISQSTVMDDKNEPSAAPEFNTPDQMLDKLTDIGFDVFNQASSHIMDMGLSGAINDIALFKIKENTALLTGLYENREEMMKPQVKEVNGIKFSFVGITESLGDYELSEESDIGILDLSDYRSSSDELEGTMKQLVESAKSVSDIVCVTVHWDNETEKNLNEDQNAIVDKLLRYGADIIVGTGKNTVSAFEYRDNGDNEQALVIPSLGKVISLEDSADSFLGGVADVTVTKDTKTNQTTVNAAKLIPTVTVYEEDYSNVRVLPLSKCTEAMIAKHGFVSTDEKFTYSYIQNYYKQKFGNTLEIKY